MRLTAENSSSINALLLDFSDGAFVDRCDCSFDLDSSVFRATFECDDFAKCLVTKPLSESHAEIDVGELRALAFIASRELERQVNEMGMMAVFNESTKIAAEELPEGYTIEIVYDDPLTNPAAEGFDWREIA